MNILVKPKKDYSLFRPTKIIGNVPKGIFLAAIFLVFSCKGTSRLSAVKANTRLSAKKIIQAHYDSQLKFNTIAGKLKIDYESADKGQSFGVSLRVKKDEVIWMSATLGIVKAKITPERVQFYNRLENEYFDGDFNYISSLLGTPIDFEQLQDLLLGNALLDLRAEKYDKEVFKDKYQLKPSTANELFKIVFRLEPSNFRIATQEISQPFKNRLLQMSYGYQTIDGKVFPKNVKILANEKNEDITIGIVYRNIEFNKNMSFPYKVPKGFKKITL